MARARARSTDPSTSHAAAASVGELTENQRAVMQVFRLVGLPLLDERLVTDYENYRRPYNLPKQSPSGLRSRRSELAKMDPPKLVEFDKKKMSTGRMGRTFGICPHDEWQTLEGTRWVSECKRCGLVR